MHKRISPHGDYDHMGEAINLVKEFELLKDVPVGYSFLDHTITAVMGNNYKVHKLLENNDQ